MQNQSSAAVIKSETVFSRFQRLSRSQRFIIVVFTIWLIQALPKWTVAITANGELSAVIMKTFITPRAEMPNDVSAAPGLRNDHALVIRKPQQV